MKASSMRRSSAALVSGIVTLILLGPAVAGSIAAIGPSTVLPGQTAALSRDFGISTAQAQQDVRTQASGYGLGPALKVALGGSYAGYWFDVHTGRFGVAVPRNASGNSLAAVGRATSAFSLTPNTYTVSVRSSWNELVAAQAEWTHQLAELFRHQHVQTSLDPEHNAVRIILSDDLPAVTVESVRALAQGASVNVEVRTVPQAQLEIRADACRYQESPERNAYCDPPLRGGVEIYSTPEGGTLYICTAGFNSVSTNRQSYPDVYTLTAGHCFTGNNEAMNGPWSSANSAFEGVQIGTRAYSYINGSGDAGIIDDNLNTSYWQDQPGTASAPYVTDYNEFGSGGAYPLYGTGTNYPGQTACHIGRTSKVRCGTTTEVNVTATINYSFGEVQVGNLVKNTACSSEGDSGGPWVSYNYGLGIDVAAYGCPTSDSWFLNLASAESALSQRIETTPEPEELGATWSARDPSTGNTNVYYTKTGTVAVWSWTTSTPWTSHTLTGQVASGTSFSAVHDPSTQEESSYYINSGHVLAREYWTVSAGWVNQTLGVQAASGTSPSVARDEPTGNTNVYYVNSSGVLSVDSYTAATGWVNQTLEGNVAANTSPSAVRDPVTGNTNVYYTTSSGGLSVDSWTEATGWKTSAIAYNVGAGTSPSPVRTQQGGETSVYYVTNNEMIARAYYISGPNWTTQILGGHTAKGTSVVSG